jgi:hypothetical protein
MRVSVVLSILLFVFVLISGGSISAQQPAVQTVVPHLVQFSGALKDAATRPIAGVNSVTFAIYADQEGGAALWSETQNVLADANGHYSTVLGVATTGGFPVDLFGTTQSRWLGVAIARQTEMPRILMASVPYALKAGDAETLGGLPASSYVTTQQLEASNARPATTFVNGGGSTIIATPGVATALATQASASGASTNSSQSSAIQATPTGSGTTDYVALWTSGSNLGNSLLFQTGGKVGVGTTSPAATLDINGGEILRGGFYEYPEDTATATNGGRPSHSFQWLASTYNSSSKAAVDYAFGFRAVQLNNNTSTPAAKLDLFYGTGGPTGTIADTGLSIDKTGLITFLPGQLFNGSSVALTGELNVNTTDAEPIFSQTSASVADGVYASAMGFFGIGVEAHGGNEGIYAAGGNYAGYFQGNVDVVGSLSKSAGSFKIDHPLDPANKYLYHSFVESPDMKNVYDGVVTTDAKGLAIVTMPDWFEALNRDFRYQLTTLGQPAQTWIAKKIANGQFTIQTDKPNVEVSWQITGIRQDAYANAHRIPVEEEKTDAEKGHFLHPALFGHAGEPGIGEMRPGPDGKLVPIQTKSAPK